MREIPLQVEKMWKSANIQQVELVSVICNKTALLFLFLIDDTRVGCVGSSRGEVQGYCRWVAQLVDGLKIGVPWIMCKQEDCPEPTVPIRTSMHAVFFTPT